MYRLVITRWNSALVCVKDTEMSLGTNPERGVIQDLSSCRMCPYGKFQPKSLSVAPECTSCPAGTTSDGSQEGGMRMTSVDHCYYSRVIRRRWSQ
jgi:hypothetical protein